MFGKIFSFIGSLISTGLFIVIFVFFIPILWLGAGALGGIAQDGMLGATLALAVLTALMVGFFVGMFKITKKMDNAAKRMKNKEYNEASSRYIPVDQLKTNGRYPVTTNEQHPANWK